MQPVQMRKDFKELEDAVDFSQGVNLFAEFAVYKRINMIQSN